LTQRSKWSFLFLFLFLFYKLKVYLFSTINIINLPKWYWGTLCIEDDKTNQFSGLAWTRDHFPRVDFHPTIEFMITVFSCQEKNISLNIVQWLKYIITSFSVKFLVMNLFLLAHFYIQSCTLISTSSKMMQLISLTPAPTRTFAEMETLGPICSRKKQTRFIWKS
jgi:hypothetical protein